MAGIYIHIPFCKQACHYCDFHFSTNTSYIDDMIAAIVKELQLQSAYLGNKLVNTVYLGGGTPSLLNHHQLHSLFSAVKKIYQVSANAEVTLEANPDDLSLSKLEIIKSNGVNRLSIGIQSFDDNVLKYLNRQHSAKNAVDCVQAARSAGFDNISIDLIYSIPGQSFELWKKNIHEALRLDPEHISSYSLTVEEKTVFGNWFNNGKLKPVEDDEAAQQLETLVHIITDHGYEQYEVSNFSRAGYYSKHNSSYWKGEHYLGVGPGAHSYNGRSRQSNIKNNHLYIKSIRENRVPFESEVLTAEDHVNEYLLTRLRTSWGVDVGFVKQHYNYDVTLRHAVYIQSLIDNRCATLENELLKLTTKGKLLADKIASDLFL